MQGLLDRIHRARQPPFHTMSARAAKLAYSSGAEVLDLPRAPLPRVEDLQVPGPAGPLAARLYAAGTGRLPVLLYLHGGGFVVGGLDTHDSLCRQLALCSDAAVLALDYRLGPEHRFPAAQDDAWGALRWLAGPGADVLGLDPRRIAVGGDSAGGTLAAVCALHARDAALPLAAQLLVTPGTAADDAHASRHLFGNGFLLDAVTMDWFFDQVIERGQRHDWRFAPLNADDLASVAPACVILAECDPLADEGLAYADRLRMAGVPVKLDLVRGVTHDFIKMGRALPQAAAAQQFAADFLRQAWKDSE